MIISASRRSDIPAYYAEWLMGRLDAGYCLVRNPYDARRGARVNLSPQDVEFLVLWTRDSRPILPHMRELDARGIRSYVQFTITDYPSPIEPGAPGLAESLRAFRELSDAIGSRRALWRYDPIFVAEGLDADFHRAAFERIAAILEGYAERVTLSLLDKYAGTASRLARAGYPGALFGSPRGALRGARRGSPEAAGQARAATPEPYPELLADLASIAKARGMRAFACAEPYDLSPLGIEAGACVDASLAASIWGPPGGQEGHPAGSRSRTTSGLRPACRCAASVDIGAYRTCPRGCAYCYANRGSGRLAARGREDESL